MGTIAEQINYLAETKTAIKDALVAKGVSVADTDTFRSYADKIASIETGGGGGISIEYWSIEGAPYLEIQDIFLFSPMVKYTIPSEGEVRVEPIFMFAQSGESSVLLAFAWCGSLKTTTPNPTEAIPCDELLPLLGINNFAAMGYRKISEEEFYKID